MDSGRLKEYDEPYILLQNKESLFYKMVQQLGKAEAAALTETAKQVSAPRGVVIRVRLSSSLLAIWHQAVLTSTLCPCQLQASGDKASWLGLNNTSQVEVRSATH